MSSITRRVFGSGLILSAIAAAPSLSAATPLPPTTQANPEEEVAALEQKFAALLTHAELVGSYTNDGDPAAPKVDRYQIFKAVKGQGETWDITFNMGHKVLPIPLTIGVTVKWAGDTPVLELTNYAVPGVGVFTARILVYGDRYAGTWSGKTHGGLMFGRIEHPAAAPATKPATP